MSDKGLSGVRLGVGGPEPSIPPGFTDAPIILDCYIATGTKAGANLMTPASGDGSGEAIDLRYKPIAGKTAGQFQGLYMRCTAPSVAATTLTIRAAELQARQQENYAIGALVPLHVNAYLRGSGNVGSACGADIQAELHSGYTGTVTALAGLRVRVVSEDGATITAGYGIEIENRAQTGIKRLDAAILVKDNPAREGGFGVLIDCRDAALTVHDTDMITLIAFKDSAGNALRLVYDPTNATVVAVQAYS